MDQSSRNIGLIVGVVLACSVMAGCVALAAAGAALFVTGNPDQEASGGGDRLLQTFFETEHETLADWEGAQETADNWAVVWPESARDIHLAEDGFMDPIYHFRMTADANDLDGLITSAACGGLLAQADSTPPNKIITADLPWWTPGQATTFASCVGQDSPEAPVIFLDRSNPAETIIYVSVILL